MAIDYEKRDGVAYITLNQPQKANILDKETSDAISDAWIDMWEDREIRCAILTGTGAPALLRGTQSHTQPGLDRGRA